jgi:hypothetical protein
VCQVLLKLCGVFVRFHRDCNSLILGVVILRRSAASFCSVVLSLCRSVGSFSSVVPACHPAMSSCSVIPRRRSTTSFTPWFRCVLFLAFRRTWTLWLCCSLSPLGILVCAQRWEVGTSRVARQGGPHALQFDGNLSAIHVGCSARTGGGGLALTQSVHLVRAMIMIVGDSLVFPRKVSPIDKCKLVVRIIVK